MMKRKPGTTSLAVLMALLTAGAVSAQTPLKETITLTIPALSNGPYKYYPDLLKSALEAAGYKAELVMTSPVPKDRALYLLGEDKISLMWLVQNPANDAKFVPVPVGLTNGLIGDRILLIPKGGQEIYDGVKSLEDFRALGKVGAFGQNWFDTTVWKANSLKFVEKEGDWSVIYNMVAAKNRGIDYFSLGFNEVVGEASAHPNLDIEKHLVLIYERDQYFYLSKSAAKYRAAITDALTKAKEKGLIDKLVRAYYADDYEKLGFDKRLKLRLVMPQ